MSRDECAAAQGRRIEELEAAMRCLLDVADRTRSGERVQSEEWYAIRDHARKVLDDA